MEALSLFQDEMYNHQIFSEIIMKLRPNIKFIKKKKKIINIKKKNLNQKYSFLLKTLSYRLKKENGNNEIFILSSYLGLLREILLQIKLNGFLRFNFCEEIKRKFQIDSIKRNIKLKDSKSFLRMLKLMVIQNLPASYLEGYDYVKTLGYKKKWPNNPKKIFTSVSHLYSDVFKVWLAEKREKRSKFIVGQHGIGYLVSKFHSQYDLDLTRSDKLIFWGNKKFKDKKIIKGFNFLSRSKINRTKNFYITMVQKFPHKYLTKLISNDYNISTIDQNIKSQKIFLSSLSKKFQNQIKIRYCFSNNFFPDVYNYEKKYWSDIKDKFKFESRSTPMNKSLKTTKLVILNSIHSTLFFECLSNDIPCIIFSNFLSDSFYKEGKKDFKSLQKVGIIHNDPIKLSKFINKNFENLNSWWNGREVNRVKKKFIEKYCRFESNPIKAISKILSTC